MGMKQYRYYTMRQRPWSIPCGGLRSICDYRRRREVKTDVGRTYAWGYAQYDRQLTLEEIQRYELAYGGEVEG